MASPNAVNHFQYTGDIKMKDNTQLTEQELDQVVGGGKLRDLIDKLKERRRKRKGLPPIHDENCPPHGEEDTYTPIIII